MATTTSIMRNNFAGGEVGPHVMGRIDLPAYQVGCKRLENFMIGKLGDIRRRPGTYYVAAATGAARLIPWLLPDGTFLIIELSNLRARYINPAGTITISNTTTPWATADLPGIRWTNIKGVLYLVHPSYAPRTLTWTTGSPPTVAIASPTFTGTAFNTATNYPANVAFYAGRLWFQGTATSPRGLWGSCTFDPATYADRYTVFVTGADPDDAIYIVESAMGAKPLDWLEPLLALMAGGASAIWQQNGSGTVPESFDMCICSATGSAAIQAKAFGGFIVYVGAGGNSLHALSYSDDAGGYSSTEIAFSGRHLLAGGVKEFDVETAPDMALWIVTTDGKLLSFHLDTGTGVAGMAYHPMPGATVESVCTARSGNVDRVYLVVNRSGVRTIEFIDPGEYTTIGPADDTNTPGGMHYVDSGIYIKGASPATTFTGLTHLEGKEVDALGDGAVMPRVTVASGAVTYPESVTRIHIGRPMQALVQPTPPEIPTNGTGQDKKRRVERLTLRVVDSYGGKIGTDETVEDKMHLLPDFEYGETVYGAAPVLYSGDKGGDFPGTNEINPTIIITQDEPLPFHLVGIIEQISVGDK
jgi:hypothetical protein